MRKLQKQKEKEGLAGMVTNPLEDPALLKEADLGVIMGSGTKEMEPAADVMLLNHDFRDLNFLLRYGRSLWKTKKLYLALGAIFSIAGLSGFAWFLARPFGIEEPLTLSLGFLAIFLITVLRRLTAPRTSLSESISMGELEVNRLLFDRDIRSREAWISRVPTEVESAEPPFRQPGKQANS